MIVVISLFDLHFKEFMAADTLHTTTKITFRRKNRYSKNKSKSIKLNHFTLAR